MDNCILPHHRRRILVAASWCSAVSAGVNDSLPDCVRGAPKSGLHGLRTSRGHWYESEEGKDGLGVWVINLVGPPGGVRVTSPCSPVWEFMGIQLLAEPCSIQQLERPAGTKV